MDPSETPQLRHSSEDLASYVETLMLHRKEHAATIDPELAHAIDQLPSRYYITREMSVDDLVVFEKTIDFCWKRLTGNHLPKPNDQEKTSNTMFLDGCYWLVPGGVLIYGINHYSAIKKNKGLFCSLLNLNPLVIEQKLASEPNEIIRYMIVNGAARMVVNRDESKVFCQTSQESWPWVRDKLSKMYHRVKIAKVLDPTKTFKGWQSGVPVRINR